MLASKPCSPCIPNYLKMMHMYTLFLNKKNWKRRKWKWTVSKFVDFCGPCAAALFRRRECLFISVSRAVFTNWKRQHFWISLTSLIPMLAPKPCIPNCLKKMLIPYFWTKKNEKKLLMKKFSGRRLFLFFAPYLQKYFFKFFGGTFWIYPI